MRVHFIFAGKRFKNDWIFYPLTEKNPSKSAGKILGEFPGGELITMQGWETVFLVARVRFLVGKGARKGVNFV